MNLRKILSYMHTICILIKTHIIIMLRKMNVITDKKGIGEFKNKYKGRCFIVCTGPSLMIKDLEMLHNEYTISMNSICNVYEKTSWRPNMYVIQDERAFLNIKHLISNDSINVCSTRIYNNNKEICQNLNFYSFYLNYGLHGSRLDKKFITKKFSTNPQICIEDGYTATYTALQMAVYMGFNEIILLGCDNNLSTASQKHFTKTVDEDQLDWSTWDYRMYQAYCRAKKFADENGIKLINASRGGDLDLFERRQLKEILRSE